MTESAITPTPTDRGYSPFAHPEWLNVDQSPEELEEVHGTADYYAYLRSPEFVEAFIRPVGEICQRLDAESMATTGRGAPVLDAGCGDGLLVDHVGLCVYVGFDGSRAAMLRALSRSPRGVGAYVLARFEDPPSFASFVAVGFRTLVLSGILEVLVKPEARVPMLEYYRRIYGIRHFVICDLERLDTTLLQGRYGPPVEEQHRVAANPGSLPDVKLKRKILVFAADRQGCFFCRGRGEYCFPEGAATDRSDGWYKCDKCGGTGYKEQP